MKKNKDFPADDSLRDDYIRKMIEGYALIDDAFFRIVMKDNVEAAEAIVRVALNMPDVKIESVKPQYGTHFLDNRGVCFDLGREGRTVMSLTSRCKRAERANCPAAPATTFPRSPSIPSKKGPNSPISPMRTCSSFAEMTHSGKASPSIPIPLGGTINQVALSKTAGTSSSSIAHIRAKTNMED